MCGAMMALPPDQMLAGLGESLLRDTQRTKGLWCRPWDSVQSGQETLT